jgi:putative endopeptidase
MNRRLISIAVVFAGTVALAGARQTAPLKSGIDASTMDTSVRPQDDFFRHVNGGWLARTPIPADRSSYGAFDELADTAEQNVRAIIEDAAKNPNHASGSVAQQVGDLYASFMNEARADQLGVSPIKPELDRIDALKTPADLAQYVGHLSTLGISGPVDGGVEADAKNPAVPIVYLGQAGTALPDRDYYLKDDPKLVETRQKYQAYLEKVFALVGRPAAAADAQAVLAIETEFAKIQWTKVESRDAVKTYNKFALASLATEMPGFDWAAWARAQHLDRAPDVVIQQPSFFKGFAALVPATPMSTWKAWLVAQFVNNEGAYLNKAIVDARFDFFGKVLNGQQEIRPRWKRGVQLVNNSVGEAVGHLYVDRHFPPASKARMQRLIANLLDAYKQSINTVEWMTPETRKEALDKLAKFTTKIGYPDTWRDYSTLVIKADDLIGNVQRANTFEHDRQIAKLGKPVDRGEWLMTPQTINAYYNPLMNEIVFPAAILQPPFFNVEADDAVNYGGIGAVIGHEIGHGFDDQGRHFDGDGKLRDWWKPADEQAFLKRTKMLVDQFNAYSPIPGMHVNGELTLGENIGDLGGLGIAYQAYKLSLGGKPAPVIDRLTGDQRFFTGWAQVWRGKRREEFERALLLSNEHAPDEYRANGPVSNVAAFYDAFGVKPGDKLYREPDQRVRIW